MHIEKYLKNTIIRWLSSFKKSFRQVLRQEVDENGFYIKGEMPENTWDNQGVLAPPPPKSNCLHSDCLSAETQRPTVIVKLWPSIIESWQTGASQSGTSSFLLQWVLWAEMRSFHWRSDAVFQNNNIHLRQDSTKTVRWFNTNVKKPPLRFFLLCLENNSLPSDFFCSPPFSVFHLNCRFKSQQN